MLKVLIDFLSINWQAFSQAPLAFLIATIIGFAIGFAFQKHKIDMSEAGLKSAESEKNLLKRTIEYRDEEIKRNEQELLRKEEELEKSKEEIAKLKFFLEQLKADYAVQLVQYTDTELSKEAEKMSGKLRKSALQARQKDGAEHHIPTGLYNEWLFEGPKLLALKREILKRLPADMTYHLDQVSDSRYTSPAFDVDSVLDGVEELSKLAAEINELTAESNS